MKKLWFNLVIFSCIFLSFFPPSTEARNTTLLHVGVILNLNSTMGRMANMSISMAYSDFYAVHRNFSSKLKLHIRDSEGDVMKAASAALDLVENVRVQAMIGPQTSEEADFIAYIGNQTHVPTISFSSISFPVSSRRFPYFVQLAQNELSQVKAIVAIIEAYKWKEVSIIHDDSQSGSAIVPFLSDALNEIGILVSFRSVLPFDANAQEMNDTLNKLIKSNMRVFIVHLSFSLATRFFSNVNQAKLMQVGYAWITTCTLGDQLSNIESPVFHSMKGVIGLKTAVPTSKALHRFRVRWRRKVKNQGLVTQFPGANVYALWAYDTVFLMAMAANRVRFTSEGNFQAAPSNSKSANKSMDFHDSFVSPIGSELLKSVLAMQLTGLSGEIRFVNNQVQSSSFEIVNLRKSFHRIGYWTPDYGLSRSLSSKVDNEQRLGDVIWPGGSTAVPSRVLRVGVPFKTGFLEFINVSCDSENNLTNVSGFSKVVFEAVMQKFSYQYKYEPYPSCGVPAGSYDNLTYEVFLKKYDIVVGDVTILANRSEYVSFTPSYTDPGVQMIVPAKMDQFTNDLWWFLEPLDMKLWFTTIAFFLWKGILVWIFEHGTNSEFQGTLSQQLGKMLSFSFSIFVFAHREELKSNYSRFVVNTWTFAVFVLVTSYGAQLTSMLAFQNLKPTLTYLKYLQINGHTVGYQDGSFVVHFLNSKGFYGKQLKNLSTVKEYADALSKGTNNNGVSAIIDEIPYINVFLCKYPGQYTVTGDIYPSGGLGFVFPKYAPLLSDVSKEVLNLVENKTIEDIQKNWSVSGACQVTNDPLTSNITSNQLQVYSFRSLYLILAVTSLLTLLAFSVSLVYRSFQDGASFGELTEASLKGRMSSISRCFKLDKKGTVPDNFEDIEQLMEGEELQDIHQVLSITGAERPLENIHQITLADEETLGEETPGREPISDKENDKENAPVIQRD